MSACCVPRLWWDERERPMVSLLGPVLFHVLAINEFDENRKAWKSTDSGARCLVLNTVSVTY